MPPAKGDNHSLTVGNVPLVGGAGDDFEGRRIAAHGSGECLVLEAEATEQRGNHAEGEAGKPPGGYAVAAAGHRAHQEHDVSSPTA